MFLLDKWLEMLLLSYSVKMKGTPPTAFNVDKMHVDDITFYEMVFGVPPYLFENMKLWKYAKEISDTLKYLFENLRM